MPYVDGFLCAVPATNRDAWQEHAVLAGAVFRECGALQVVDCWGDDVPEGTLTSMPKAVDRQADEVVVLSWIVWPSRAARDAGMERAMTDPRLAPEHNPMPFDGRRAIFGGFEQILNLQEGA